MKSDPQHSNCQQWVDDFVEQATLCSPRPPLPVAPVRAVKKSSPPTGELIRKKRGMVTIWVRT